LVYNERYINVSILTKFQEVTKMRSVDTVLQIVGNETRRKILDLLSGEPHYISQIAKKLDVTQPAILKHLSLLEKAGLIESYWRDSPAGAPRKYYKICDSVGIEIAINPRDFTVTRRPQRMSCRKYLNVKGTIERLTEEINRTEDLATKTAKALELAEIAEALLSCKEFDSRNRDCQICHKVASLRREVSQVILHVSRGEIEAGLRRLTEAMNHLVSGLMPE